MKYFNPPEQDNGPPAGQTGEAASPAAASTLASTLPEDQKLADEILGHVKDSLAAISPRNGGSERDSGERRMRSIAACKAFCDIFAPSCQVGYYRDHWLNRTECLYWGRLHFPVAIHGCLWRKDHLPTWILGDPDPHLLYPPFPTASGMLDAQPNESFGDLGKIGRFQFREDVDPERVLCVRLNWGRSTLVLFLNWRKAEALPASGVQAQEIYTALPLVDMDSVWNKLKAVKARTGRRELLDSAVSPLRPAVIYFLGFLAASDLQVPGSHDELLKHIPDSQNQFLEHNPAEVFNEVSDAAKEYSAKHLMNSRVHLAKAVDMALGQMQKVCRVHRIEKNQKTQEVEVVFDEPHEFDLKPDEDGSFPLNAWTGKLAGRSTSRAAARWRTALLLNLKDDTDKLAGANAPYDTWQSITVRRKDPTGKGILDHKYEIVLPVLNSSGEPFEVVDIASFSKLTSEHMRRTELVTLLFQKLSGIYNRSAGAQDLEIIGKLLKGPKTWLEVCKTYCKYVAKQMGAGLVRVLLYNARVGAYLPHGVWLHTDTANKFLGQEGSHPALGFTEIDRSNLHLAYRANDRPPGIHTLMEYLCAWRLIPRPEGNTRKIFATAEPLAFLDTKNNLSLDRIVRDYFPSILGLPFRPDDHAQPDGVLWISWLKHPADHSVLGQYMYDEKAFAQKAQSLLKDVTEVAAALLAIYRCFDARCALDPLPLICAAEPEKTG